MKTPMLKFIMLVFLGIVFNISLSAQDIIIRTNGEKIVCRILEETDEIVRFKKMVNGLDVETSIRKSQVSKIVYKEEAAKDPASKKTAVTVGFLNGGGSLIGVDLEFLMSPRVGLQFGAGLVGFGAGLNYHLSANNIGSTYLTLRYWHQGVGDSFVASTLGPAFVFRARKIFEVSIGVGFVLGEGPNSSGIIYTDAILTYSLGAYFPF